MIRSGPQTPASASCSIAPVNLIIDQSCNLLISTYSALIPDLQYRNLSDVGVQESYMVKSTLR